MKRVIQALDRHWFAPGSLRDLATVRIVIVAGQLVLLPGREAHLALTAASDETFLALPALKVLMLPFGEWGVRPEAGLIEAAWLLAIVTGILALVGLFTRPALLGFAATNTLLQAHLFSYGSVHHRQAILMIALWVLAFAPSGAAYSLDSLRRRTRFSLAGLRGKPGPPAGDLHELATWPLRLIQWVFVLVYLSAGLSKLSIGGLQWLNGHTLSYYLVQDGWRHGSALGLWIAGFPALTSGLAVLTVAFELTFALAVLVPRLAWVYVLVGLGIHTGIYLTQRAPFFQFMVVYVVFIEALRQHFPLRSLVPRWFAQRRPTHPEPTAERVRQRVPAGKEPARGTR